MELSKQEMELSIREMELFLLIPDTVFTKYLPFLLRSPNPVLQTGNGIIQTGNGIISPISRPQIRKLLLQKIFHL